MPIWPENLNALAAFAEVAREYCELIDSLRDGRPAEFYTTLEELLPRLQLAILPVEKESDWKERRKFKKLRMTHDQWRDLSRCIGEAVGDEAIELYKWHVSFEDEETAGEGYCATRAAMLWDDLADIYRDLHEGVLLWALGTSEAQAKAAWDWRFGYEAHWGHHLHSAMATVHEARYQVYAE